MRTAVKHFLLLAAFCLLAAAPSIAQQQFATRQRGEWQDFAYRYADSANKSHTLTFRLGAADIEQGSAEFQPWDDADARASAYRAVSTAAAQLSTPQLTLRPRPLPNGFELAISATSNSGPQKLQQLEESLNTIYLQTLQTYAQQRFYRATQKGTGTRIQPDHPRLAQRYAPAMAPVAQAIATQLAGQGANTRTFINATLTWLQTIPYDVLEDRYTSNGAGYETPYGLLLANKGDCDSKATALAALLRSRYPTLPLAMVYIPKHAFLAIGLPQGPNDFALQTEFGTYVLADATGPGRVPLGYIDARTQAELRAGNTTILPIP